MSKRKPMGAAADELFKTGADALSAVVSSEEPPPRERTNRNRSSQKVREVSEVEPVQRFMVTTVRLRPEHWTELRQAAVELSAERGGGKADASAVLRGILDEWMVDRRTD